jgi:hypothetical protein
MIIMTTITIRFASEISMNDQCKYLPCPFRSSASGLVWAGKAEGFMGSSPLGSSRVPG